MYEKFYGLTEKPFNVTPDPRFLYLSEHHREALAHLQYGVEERRGFVAIIGEVGTGKTTLLHALLNGLDSDTRTAFIFSTSLTAKGLVSMMASEFGIESGGRTKSELLTELNHFLLGQFALGINCVLIVDEAQNLSFGLLEEIRMLSNLETDKQKLLQIVLVGQTELAEKLAMPRLRQLRQRIGTRYVIHALNPQETAEYIQHRLKVAGLTTEVVFNEQAVAAVQRCSGGIPRLINLICDNAMLLGFTYEKRTLGEAIIDETITDLKAMGVLSGSSVTTEPIDAIFESREGTKRSLWRRVFKPLAMSSSLLLAAALLSLTVSVNSPREASSQSSSDLSAPMGSSWNTSRFIEVEEATPIYAEGIDGSITTVVDRVSFFSVHVASFRDLDRADRLVETLRGKGMEPVFTQPIKLAELGKWYRVLVGRYDDEMAALQAADEYLTSGAFPYASSRPIHFQGVGDEQNL